jgi:hypothetical protein
MSGTINSFLLVGSNCWISHRQENTRWVPLLEATRCYVVKTSYPCFFPILKVKRDVCSSQLLVAADGHGLVKNEKALLQSGAS